MASFGSVRTWGQRTPAVADLLNPALFAAITATAALGYDSKVDQPMPLSLAFITAPLVLHRATRDALPTRIDSHLTKWVIDNPAVVEGFGVRARALVTPVREGLRFGLRTGALTLDDEGLVGHTRGKPSGLGDIATLINRAGFTGRWFTQSDSPATVFALLGVEP